MALANGDWNLCLVSTVSIGFGFAVCCMSFAVVGERWFPPEQQMLTTSIGVQSNYAGWCFGALLIPTLVKTAEDHERFMFSSSFSTTSLWPSLSRRTFRQSGKALAHSARTKFTG